PVLAEGCVGKVALTHAHAPERVVPVVALDQLGLKRTQQFAFGNARSELLHEQIAHDANLDFFPIRTQLQGPSHPLCSRGRYAREPELLSRCRIERLRRLIRM